MRSLMLGAVLGVLAANAAVAQDKPGEAVIQVVGTGVVEDAPSVARIGFTLRGEGAVSDDALRALMARKQAVEKALGAKVRIETGDVEITEVLGRDCRGPGEYGSTPRLSTGPCAIQGYVAMMSAWADISPVTDAGTLSGLASRSGATSVRLSGFRVADPGDAMQRAMALAVANGMDQARVIAAASGARLGPLQRVTDLNGGDYLRATDGVRNPAEIGELLKPEPVNVSLSPQKITTRVQITLTYEILR